jgi:hypothetical protein
MRASLFNARGTDPGKITCLTDRLVYNARRYTPYFLRFLSSKKTRLRFAGAQSDISLPDKQGHQLTDRMAAPS